VYIYLKQELLQFLEEIYLVLSRASISSSNALLVILKLHNEWLNVLALALPLGDGFFSIRVELLLLLVEERLCLDSIVLILLELFDGLFLLSISLRLNEAGQLFCSLSVFLLFLLLSQLQLLVSDSPELSEIFVFLNLGSLFLFVTLDLESSAAFNGFLHFSLSLLLLFIESVSFVFSFGNLSIQHLLLIVLKSSQFADLTVNHALSFSLLSLEPIVFTFFLHFITSISLSSEFFDFFFLLLLLKECSLLLFKLLLVRIGQVSSDLC